MAERRDSGVLPAPLARRLDLWVRPRHARLAGDVTVCFICGGMGSLVVGNRMAFFSDALAHCAFAGVGLGLLVCFLAGTDNDEIVRQRIVLIMVAFGVTVGLLIAFVREQTGLASDTVIGVFYAGSIGFGAVVTRWSTAEATSASRISSSATPILSRRGRSCFCWAWRCSPPFS